MKSKIYVFIPFLFILLYSCKKETYEAAQNFGTVKLNNQSGLSELKFRYNNNEIFTNGSLYGVNLKIPDGEGLFSFTDPSTGKSLLDTSLNIVANSFQELVLFKPSENAPLVLMKNTQQEEPKPGPGFIKIKIANLAPICFPGKVDVLLRMTDFSYGDLVDMDVIKGVTRNFGDYGVYKLLDPSVAGGDLTAYILDPVTNQPLHNSFAGQVDINDYNNGTLYSVATLYITEQVVDAPSGNMTGTDGKRYNVEIRALFLN